MTSTGTWGGGRSLNTPSPLPALQARPLCSFPPSGPLQAFQAAWVGCTLRLPPSQGDFLVQQVCVRVCVFGVPLWPVPSWPPLWMHQPCSPPHHSHQGGQLHRCQWPFCPCRDHTASGGLPGPPAQPHPEASPHPEAARLPPPPSHLPAARAGAASGWGAAGRKCRRAPPWAAAPGIAGGRCKRKQLPHLQGAAPHLSSPRPPAAQQSRADQSARPPPSPPSAATHSKISCLLRKVSSCQERAR